MATSLKQAFSGGGGGLIELEPNLDWKGTKTVSLNPTGSEQTMLSLTGKFAVSHLGLKTNGTSTTRIVMIVDGVTIIDTTYTYGSTSSGVTEYPIYGNDDGYSARGDNDRVPFLVKNSLVIKVTRVLDPNQNASTLTYLVRPIK